jgi:hypothetical protein
VLLESGIEQNKHRKQGLNSGVFRVEERSEFARSLAGAGFEDPAQMALIREAGVACDVCKIGPTGGQCPTGILYSQAIGEFGHGATMIFAKNTRKMNGVYAHLGRNFSQRQRLAVRFL